MEPMQDHPFDSFANSSITTETVGPAGVSDQATDNDSLGFAPYVQAVSAFLVHKDTKPPLTISIEGAWGSGKSSFMRQLQQEIKRCIRLDGAKARTVWFNAWRQNKDEELWAAFALHFSEEIAQQLSWVRRRLCHIKLQWLRFEMRRAWPDVFRFAFLLLFFLYASFHIFSYVRQNPTALDMLIGKSVAAEVPIKAGEKNSDEVLLKLILASLGGAGYIFVSFMLLKKGAEVIGNPLKIDLEKYVADPQYANRLAFIDTFQSDFRKMVECYARRETVFVFIDDLDRCEVPKSAELMKALNLLISDSPNIIYILGLDREKIADGIAARFKEVLPYLTKESDEAASAIDFGLSYLEKFIQIPFQLPRPTDTDIDRLMNDINATRQPDKDENTPLEQQNVNPRILFETKVDSPLVREIVRMVAPSFEFNPRRIKQFVNCFRLQAIIASQTGMFGPPRDKKYTWLSPEQLGKLVAICLRWPRLLNEIERHPELLTDLQLKSEGKTDVKTTPQNEYWCRDQRLLDLFRYGSEEDAKYRMDKLDINRFILIARRLQSPRSEPTVSRESEPAAAYTRPSAILHGGTEDIAGEIFDINYNMPSASSDLQQRETQPKEKHAIKHTT